MEILTSPIQQNLHSSSRGRNKDLNMSGQVAEHTRLCVVMCGHYEKSVMPVGLRFSTC